MRILMLGWEFPPNISGGLGTACFGMTKGLHEAGATQVRFVIPVALNGEYDQYVELTSLSERITGVPPAVAPRSSSYGKDMFKAVAEYAERTPLLAQDGAKFDIVHGHDWLTAPAAIRLKHLTGKPLVMHIHSTEYDRSGEMANPEIVAIEQRALDEADRVVAVSDYTRRTLLARYRVDDQKIVTIHNACGDEWHARRPSRPRRPGSGKTVSFLGRVTYQKGPRYFVEAAILAAARMPELQFVMAGDGDLLPEMRCRVEEAGMQDRFYFPGFLFGEEVQHLLANSDIYVMPSVAEPFGISAVEAIQAGAAAILSKHSGVVELFEHVVKVDYSDTATIADAIVRLASDSDYADELRSGAATELSRFNWVDCAKHLNRLYGELHNVSEFKQVA